MTLDELKQSLISCQQEKEIFLETIRSTASTLSPKEWLEKTNNYIAEYKRLVEQYKAVLDSSSLPSLNLIESNNNIKVDNLTVSEKDILVNNLISVRKILAETIVVINSKLKQLAGKKEAQNDELIQSLPPIDLSAIEPQFQKYAALMSDIALITFSINTKENTELKIAQHRARRSEMAKSVAPTAKKQAEQNSLILGDDNKPNQASMEKATIQTEFSTPLKESSISSENASNNALAQPTQYKDETVPPATEQSTTHDKEQPAVQQSNQRNNFVHEDKIHPELNQEQSVAPVQSASQTPSHRTEFSTPLKEASISNEDASHNTLAQTAQYKDETVPPVTEQSAAYDTEQQVIQQPIQSNNLLNENNIHLELNQEQSVDPAQSASLTPSHQTEFLTPLKESSISSEDASAQTAQYKDETMPPVTEQSAAYDTEQQAVQQSNQSNDLLNNNNIKSQDNGIPIKEFIAIANKLNNAKPSWYSFFNFTQSKSSLLQNELTKLNNSGKQFLSLQDIEPYLKTAAKHQYQGFGHVPDSDTHSLTLFKKYLNESTLGGDIKNAILDKITELKTPSPSSYRNKSP